MFGTTPTPMKRLSLVLLLVLFLLMVSSSSSSSSSTTTCIDSKDIALDVYVVIDETMQSVPVHTGFVEKIVPALSRSTYVTPGVGLAKLGTKLCNGQCFTFLNLQKPVNFSNLLDYSDRVFYRPPQEGWPLGALANFILYGAGSPAGWIKADVSKDGRVIARAIFFFTDKPYNPSPPNPSLPPIHTDDCVSWGTGDRITSFLTDRDARLVIFATDDVFDSYKEIVNDFIIAVPFSPTLDDIDQRVEEATQLHDCIIHHATNNSR